MEARNINLWIAALLVAGTLAAEGKAQTCSGPPSGYACKSNSDNTKWVCADWSQTAAPQEGIALDFRVDYDCTGCSDAPSVTFRVADSGWSIYSELCSTGTAANLGQVLLASDVSPDSGDFGVRIIKSQGVAGAANVSSIMLDSSDVNWTGGSILADNASASYDTIITGGVTNGITLVKDSGGNDGKLSGYVLIGDDVGPVNIPIIDGTLYIAGGLPAGSDMTFETINAGKSVTVWGNLGVDSDITVSQTLAGTLTLNGHTASDTDVTITDLGNNGVFTSGGGYFNGTLLLSIGIDSADQQVSVYFPKGTINLNNEDVYGRLTLGSMYSTAAITNGGVIKSSGKVILGLVPSYTVAGTAGFESVEAGGEIRVNTASMTMDAELRIGGAMGGLIYFAGDLGSSGEIEIGGTLTGTIDCDGDTVAGSLVDIDALSGTATIDVAGTCDGSLAINKGTTANTIIACGNLDENGTIVINDTEGNYDAGGSVYVGPIVGPCPINAVTFDGCIRVYDNDPNGTSGSGGNLTGYITVTGCHSSDDDLIISVDGDIDRYAINIDEYTCEEGGQCIHHVDYAYETCP